jgi:hypothetical protein
MYTAVIVLVYVCVKAITQRLNFVTRWFRWQATPSTGSSLLSSTSLTELVLVPVHSLVPRRLVATMGIAQAPNG